MKKQIRRLVNTKSSYQCVRCGKSYKNANQYEYRQQQFVSDYVPDIQRPICRNCIYSESFGSKGLSKRKKANQIEEETILYIDIE